ncbi:hypothetical protein BLNAU_15462 [Blattamonas nauphoetae]|uniref:Thioredoxin domain-containing protein n=1 Tax=Blattamonas nauphoetae TaxID=2049346 RepID=A0ABQ9XG39_9EUKA|nr:hypothetical protein BLNAU_15462 [Blattamonas nauphoetae]
MTIQWSTVAGVQEILQGSQQQAPFFTIVAFLTRWNPSCKNIYTSFQEILARNELSGVRILFVDIEQNLADCKRFLIHSTPSVQFFWKGQILTIRRPCWDDDNKFVGSLPLDSWIELLHYIYNSSARGETLMPVHFGEAKLPPLRNILTASFLKELWLIETEEDQKSYLNDVLFEFGDTTYRQDIRAEQYLKFYHKFFLFCKHSGFSTNVSCALAHILSETEVISRKNRFTLPESITQFQTLLSKPYVFPEIPRKPRRRKLPPLTPEPSPIQQDTPLEPENEGPKGKKGAKGKNPVPTPTKGKKSESPAKKWKETPKAKKGATKGKLPEPSDTPIPSITSSPNPDQLSESLNQLPLPSDLEANILTPDMIEVDDTVPTIVVFSIDEVSSFATWVMQHYFKHFNLISACFGRGRKTIVTSQLVHYVAPVAFPSMAETITLAEHEDRLEKERQAAEEARIQKEIDDQLDQEENERQLMADEDEHVTLHMQYLASLEAAARQKAIESEERATPAPRLPPHIQALIDRAIADNQTVIDEGLNAPFHELLSAVLQEVHVKMQEDEEEEQTTTAKATKRKK